MTEGVGPEVPLESVIRSAPQEAVIRGTTGGRDTITKLIGVVTTGGQQGPTCA